MPIISNKRYLGWRNEPHTNSPAKGDYNEISDDFIGLAGYNVELTKTEETIGGDGPQGHVLTGHEAGTISFDCKSNDRTRGLLRYIGSNKKLYLIEIPEGSGSATTYIVNAGVGCSGSSQGLTSISVSGNIAEAPKTVIVA